MQFLQHAVHSTVPSTSTLKYTTRTKSRMKPQWFEKNVLMTKEHSPSSFHISDADNLSIVYRD